MTHPSLLAIDAGQTGMKLRLRWSDGTSRDGVEAGVRTDRPLAPQLTEVIEKVSHAAGVADTVSIGVSGVTDANDLAADIMRAQGLAALQRLLVTHDSVTSFLGALGDRAGAVIAVGTGVVTLGVGRRAARVDGWGNIMGDAGSGYWIGRAALDAVMRAHDGRGPATGLSAVAQERWPDLEAAYSQLQNSPDRIRTVASLARDTAVLAEAGDPVALRICHDAVGELALSAVTALRVADAPDDAPVVAIGGVLRSALINDAFTRAVRTARPNASFPPPVGTGLDGTAALASLTEQHPLRDRIAEITRIDSELAGAAC